MPEPAIVAEVDGMAARELSRIDLLIEQSHWEDAIGAIMRLIDSDETGLVRTEDHRYSNLRAWCQRLIARLPPEALVLYRQRIDRIALRWYRQAIADRDRNQLQHLIERALCSNWGDDGLLALGELALEQGDYQQARNAWQCISREIWLVPGRAHGGLNYPDTDLDLAGLQARLAMVSIREGQFQRADLEIVRIEQRFPDARGWLAGRDGPYADRLRELLREAQTTRAARPSGRTVAAGRVRAGMDWPTYAGSARRTNAASRGLGPRLRRQWSIRLDPRQLHSPSSELTVHEAKTADRRDDTHPCGPCPIPVAIGPRLFYAAQGQVHAVDLATGQAAWGGQSAIYTFQRPVPASDAGGAARRPGLTMHLSGSRSKLFVTAISPQAVSRQGPLVSSADGPGHDELKLPLVGFHLEQDGAVCFHRDPDAPNWFYAGAPLVDRSRVLAAMIEQDVWTRLWIACFDIGSGQLLWRRPVCELPWSPSVDQNHYAPVHLTLDSGIVYCNSNRGAIVAMRARDGHLLWLRTYLRSTPSTTDQQVSSSFPLKDWPGADWSARPCLFHQGLLLVAPADIGQLLALDPANGLLVWSAELPTRDTRLVGVVSAKGQTRLVLSDSRLWGWRLDAGQPITGWGDGCIGKEGETTHTGGDLPGCRDGLGVIAGETVYWPTESGLLAIDGHAGRITKSSLEWPQQGGAGLIATGRHLIVTSCKQLTVFKAANPPSVERSNRVE